MIRTPVSSSNLKSVGYDDETGTLEIEFHSGGIYQYYQVPVAVYDRLMGPGSRGSYFASVIKGRFRYRQIR